MKLSVRWVLATLTLCMGSVGAFAQARLTQTVDLSTWQGGSLGPLPPLPLPATGFSLSSIAFDPGIGVIYAADYATTNVYQISSSGGGITAAVSTNGLYSTADLGPGPAFNTTSVVMANPLNHRWMFFGPGGGAQFTGTTFAEADNARGIVSSGAWDPVTNHTYGALGSYFVGAHNLKFIFWGVPCATGANAVAYHPVNSRVYVSCGTTTSGGLAVYDGQNDVRVGSGLVPDPARPIATVLYGRQPAGIAVNPNTNRVYLSGATSATTLDVVDASTYQPIASAAGLPDQSGIWLINNANILPRPIAINTRTNMIYVLNSASSTISVFDGKTNALTGTIAVPIPDGAVVSQPYDPTTGPVDLKSGNTIYTQSTSTLSTLGGAIAMTVNEADNLLYVATVTGKVLIYTLDPPTAPPAYSLNGVIRDTFGAPSAGITVKAAGTNGTATAVTDANGVFFLTGLPTGTYTVTPTPGAFSFSPASVTVAINDQNTGGVTIQQNPPVAPGSFSLNPWAMIGPGVTTTGTITLNQPAPAGGVIVTLTSSNTKLVKLPSTVTVPAGQISVLLPIQGSGASAPTPVTLTAIYNGSSASTTLTVAPADKLTLNYALLSLSQAQLFITATDSNPQATLQVYLASGNQFLGTMVNQGNGSYTFQMPFVQSGIAVNVVSNLGGKVGKGIGITF